MLFNDIRYIEQVFFVIQEDGNWDNSMFAQDCFHLNRQGHYGMAYMLWNTMVSDLYMLYININCFKISMQIETIQ